MMVEIALIWFGRRRFNAEFRLDSLVKSHELNYRWLSEKVHIQGVVFFQERGNTHSMPSVCKNTTTQ